MAVVAGIDGCPSGWLCLTKDLATGKVVARILPSSDHSIRLEVLFIELCVYKHHFLREERAWQLHLTFSRILRNW